LALSGAPLKNSIFISTGPGDAKKKPPLAVTNTMPEALQAQAEFIDRS
jgi:hypothetical protein